MFEKNARSGAEDNLVPTQRQIVLKGYYAGIPPQKSKPLAEAYFDEIVASLTRPLTDKETKPQVGAVRESFHRPITVSGATQAEAIEQLQMVFNDNHWSDGLAILPPTREAVDLMLTGTSRKPGEVLGKLKPKSGAVTIEKIAINAVMAGASPRHLPVIIAALEAQLNPEFDALHPAASMGGFELAIWVSGPLAAELGMKARDRLWTHGNRANSAIGRAIMLCRINLGHTWPGENDMALTRAVPFTNYTFAENYESPNPWTPYHTAYGGHDPKDSFVTVSTVGARSTTVTRDQAQDLVKALIDEIQSVRPAMFSRYRPGVANVPQTFSKFVYLVTPEAAADLAAQGYTQKSLRQHIFDATSVPFEALSPEEVENIRKRLQMSRDGQGLITDHVPPDRIAAWEAALKPGGKVPLLSSPDDLHFVVSGTGRKSITTWTYLRSVYTWTSNSSARIHGARLTQAGR
ncbi:MAG: hypothetical protein IT494_04255 [Gammaproteobacteria bacterium]|nr:hypothetical protein [Gammaproteobacteria bacterium]